MLKIERPLMKISNTLVVFDLETTGTWVEKDKIVEIAIVKLYPDGNKDIYHKRVNPGIPIPKFVSELIKITDSDVQDAPAFKDIAQEVVDFIDDSDIAGFNVERFDLPLLERELEDVGINFDWRMRKIFDAQKIFHLNVKRDLTAAYEYYCDKEMLNAHSALADTEATLAIIENQVEKYGNGDENIDVLKQFEYVATCDYYDDDRKFRWWNGKLYMMFGKYARNYSLQEVVKRDKGYLEWILSANFSQEVKDLVSSAIKGNFPVPK